MMEVSGFNVDSLLHFPFTKNEGMPTVSRIVGNVKPSRFSEKNAPCTTYLMLFQQFRVPAV